MSLHELFLRLLVIAKPVLPAAITVVVITALAVVIIAILSRGLWINQKRFRILGLFCAMSRGDCLRLACAWIKFLFLAVFIVSFEKLEVAGYICFVVPAIVYSVSVKNIMKIPGRLLWVMLEFIGLLTTNLICGYYYDMHGGKAFMIIYIIMAIFMLLFGCYLFLTEIEDISEGRGALKQNV